MQVLSIMAAFGPVAVGTITYFYQKKQHRQNGLMEVFKILSSEEHRDAREVVYRQYEDYAKTKEFKVFFVQGVGRVKADFDIVGTLTKTGNVDKVNFFRQFGPSAYLCWQRLKDHIQHERRLRNFPHYMRDFEWLAKEAKSVWLKENIDLTTVNVYDKEEIK
jgi:hypothetical protein